MNRGRASLVSAAAARTRWAASDGYHVALEGKAVLRLDVANYEDERRLRGWLRVADVVADLPQLVDRLLEDLDEREAA